jgi:hypothetical protein
MTVWFGCSATLFFATSLFLIWPQRPQERAGLGAAYAGMIMLGIYVAILINFVIASFFFLRSQGGAVPKVLVGAATLPVCFVLGSWAWQKAADPQDKRGLARLQRLHDDFARMSPPEMLAAIEPEALRRRVPDAEQRITVLVFATHRRLKAPSTPDDLLLALLRALRNEKPGQTLPALRDLHNLPHQAERALAVWMPALWPPAAGERWSEWVDEMLSFDGRRGDALARVVREHKIDFAARDKDDPCLRTLLRVPTTSTEHVTRSVLALGAHVDDEARRLAATSGQPELVQLLR